ncbi:hypothetical protein ACH5RR_013307 [Cinchona calisaya]|uniref:Uncharacterized protein n=1 Tax=Cinchona calisaya TaxID=153742 RepID=A0ABD3A2Z4_9GENT
MFFISPWNVVLKILAGERVPMHSSLYLRNHLRNVRNLKHSVNGVETDDKHSDNLQEYEKVDLHCPKSEDEKTSKIQMLLQSALWNLRLTLKIQVEFGTY